VPQCSLISSLGKTDSLTGLSWNHGSCDNNQRLSNPADNGDQFSHEWNMVPVSGKVNTYNIVGKDNSCGRKFLSVGSGCNQTYVDLWNRDDNSGRQQWTIVQVAGTNGFTLTVGGRNCDRVHLSTRDVWDRVDLWNATNDNNQWFEIKACESVLHQTVLAPVALTWESENLFANLDVNDNGILAPVEIHADQRLSEAYFMSALRDYDYDGDYLLSRDEFRDMCQYLEEGGWNSDYSFETGLRSEHLAQLLGKKLTNQNIKGSIFQSEECRS
jgi:hypothetical protein